MNNELDSLMERASVALARMDYLACEALCRQALAEARQAGDWAYYARILLPLQESRRQRRLIASEGTIRLGTADLAGDLDDWLDQVDRGCIVVTMPHTPEQAHQLDTLAHQRQRFVEVLFAEGTHPQSGWAFSASGGNSSGGGWMLRSFDGPEVRCEVSAPPAAWHNRDLSRLAAERLPGGGACPQDSGLKTQDWFLMASEALGDAAIRQVTAPLGSITRVTELEAMLAVVVDHELLHQRLWEAARTVP